MTTGSRRKLRKKGFLEFNENKCTIYTHLRDTLKAVVMVKFIALNAFTMNLVKSLATEMAYQFRVLVYIHSSQPSCVRSQQSVTTVSRYTTPSHRHTCKQNTNAHEK